MIDGVDAAGTRVLAGARRCPKLRSHMGSDDDDRWETPPGFGQTLGSPELAPGSLDRPRRSADEHAAQTDALIREDVARALEDSAEDTDDVTANVQDGEVSLDGVVADATAMQAVEALVERVAGVKRVRSRLRVA